MKQWPSPGILFISLQMKNIDMGIKGQVYGSYRFTGF